MAPPITLQYKSAYLLLRRAKLALEDNKHKERRTHLASFIALVGKSLPRCAFRVERAKWMEVGYAPPLVSICREKHTTRGSGETAECKALGRIDCPQVG